MHPKKVICRIPKDPRSQHSIFLTQLPIILKDRIEASQWNEYISGLNDIIFKKEKASIWNIINIFYVKLFIRKLRLSYADDISSYLDNINAKLQKIGVSIENPCDNGLIELIIYINLSDE